MIIAETGFGTGLNFLMLWQAWEEAQCPCSIRFYSFEKFPLDLETAKTCHRAWQNDLGPWIHQLENEWPNQQKEGWQSINFCDGKLLLNIYHGDISDGLKHWPPQTQPDIWFLDGFSPAKNRDLWSDELFDHMAKTAKKGTRMSTFTAAGFVRRGLKERGYQMEKVKGYGTKREMLKGFFSSNDKS
jgi:tRNA 5-methylaminomethyl-2-thiouridine biosynthesis bifunctional protein